VVPHVFVFLFYLFNKFPCDGQLLLGFGCQNSFDVKVHGDT